MHNTTETLKCKPWISDQGDGTFVNPVLHADYSDPDVIRVGEDFYMTASSFSHIPGLPILHSKDLINWTLINHVIQRMDMPGYDKPQHGNGVWAPALRYHAGKFWMYYGDPDVGIFMSTADDPAGEWEPLHLVKEGKGLIDTCPFWDDDGQAYLVHAFANSRAGIKHKFRLCKMSSDGKQLLDEGQIIFDGTEHHPTLEGPKMYKRNGYYYIFAPAGGVATGWQTILRASSIYGPYEDKIVLHQGDTAINGPHQGGWVELESGESWFLHFQDKGAYGRILHLQPVRWVDDWPLMGIDRNGDGIGEPVVCHPKPNVGKDYPVAAPADSDEFDGGSSLGLQWQWQANPSPAWYSLDGESHLRLYAQPLPADALNLYHAPHLLMQKFPAESFQAEALLDCTSLQAGERAGLIVFGYNYAYVALQKKEDGSGFELLRAEGNGTDETVVWTTGLTAGTVVLRVTVTGGASCRFEYSIGDGSGFAPCGETVFEASKGHWVGAKVGLFALRPQDALACGYVDSDWFRVTQTV